MGLLDLIAAIGAAPLTIIGSSLAIALGISGAIVALIKLPSDRSSASMAQAQGANEALVQSLAAVERERDYWKNRFETCHGEKNDALARLARIQHARGDDDDASET